MSITISLSPEEEKRLRERADRAGQDVADYVRQLIHHELHGVSEALTPFRREVDESGMTDAELRGFFEDVREEIWQEKQGNTSGRS